MGDNILLGVDFLGEWVERSKCYAWIPKVKETRPILVSRNITYDELVDKIIRSWGVSDDPRDLCISYMLSVAAKQKTAPSKIRSDDDVQLYMADVDPAGARPTLRVSVIPRPEGISSSNEQDMHVEMDEDELKQGGEADEEGEEGGEAVGNPSERAPSLSSRNDFFGKDGTGFVKGMTFKNKRELVVKLRLAAVRKPFSFKAVKNTKRLFYARCVDANCKWWLRALRYHSSDTFYITIYNGEHTCGVQHLQSHHKHATADVVGEYMKDRYIEGKGITPKDIRVAFNRELGCNISYWKSLKGCEIAKAIARGTHEHSYEILEAYSYMVRSQNIGSKTALKLDSCGRFKYFFISYGSWIRGFLYMRKVLAIDGTHLSGKYGGVLLSAVAQDAEKHIFPVAFCVVDKECDASYDFFFEQLVDIAQYNDELSVISDRHKSIAKSVAKWFPQAHYGVCTRHLAENIRTKFQFGDHLGSYYLAADAYRVEDFRTHFKQIEDNDPRVARYLQDDVGFHKWSRCFFPGHRFAVMTSNIAESTNAMLRDEREYPIVALLNHINRTFGEKFHVRATEFLEVSTICVPSIEGKIRFNLEEGGKLAISRKGTYGFTIISPGQGAEVDLLNRTCTCREYQIDLIPCKHAMAAIRMLRPDDYGACVYDFTSAYYKLESYMLAYAEPINAVPPEEFWNVPPELLERRILPPFIDVGKGRRRKKRIPSVGEVFSSRRNKCSICKRSGHKKTTCPKRVDSGQSSQTQSVDF